ncbi:MAG: trypsin-like peptidase domain-containing protein [Tenericutes bacterium]|jgi:S1-C subfamily serine protease|nr:trypsin-like peptidase domain-containing protein [Mycoplasmatota bacterium]
MKKFFLYAFTILSLIGLSSYPLLAEVTTETTTEETTSETTNVTTEVTTDIFDDIESIDQLREDVYNDIYADVYQVVYQDILDEINAETYQQIYDDIEAGFYENYQSISVLNDQTQNEIYEVVDIANQTVIGVETYLDAVGESLGSGVIYKYDEINDLYFVITNHHVIEDGNNYKIRFEDETTVTADLLTFDEDVDIALLSFSGSGLVGLEVAALGSSVDLEKGEIVLTAGHPRGFNFFNSITLGIVAGIDRFISGESITYIQHDAAINSGNSGGPIFNLQGEVVGINVLKYASEEIEGMGFSIPIDLVKDIIADYEAQ